MKQLINYLMAILASAMLLPPVYADAQWPQVHRYVSIAGWSVNSYIVEGQNQVVIIDGQLLNQDAKKLSALINSIGKPVAAGIITHPHSDHFAGFSKLQNQLGEFPIYASKATQSHMPVFHKQFLNGFGKSMASDITTSLAPTQIVKTGQTLIFDNIKFHFDDLGPGEAENNLIIYLPEKQWLFTGDITMNHGYYYVGEGRSFDVLRQYDYLKANYANTNMVFSGHGEIGRFDIIDTHIEQVSQMRKLTLAAIKQQGLSKPLTKKAKQILINDLMTQYPGLMDYGLSAKQILSWNIYALEKELRNDLLRDLAVKQDN